MTGTITRCVVIALVLCGGRTAAQDIPVEGTKKNPESRRVDVPVPKKDSAAASPERPLPKFDLPEYVITGSSSAGAPVLEKLSAADDSGSRGWIPRMPESRRRDRTTPDLGPAADALNGSNDTYSGFIRAGMGMYFSPSAELEFGRILPDFQYTIGGNYHLTDGYAKNTKQSDGSFSAHGSTVLSTENAALNNARITGDAGFRSASFRFYGSTLPELERTLTTYRLGASTENQSGGGFPYSAGFRIRSFSAGDSSRSEGETELQLYTSFTIPVASLPVLWNLDVFTASGGLSYLDASGAVQNYAFAGLLLGGAVHLTWAVGMAGQNILRLRPHFSVVYQFNERHRFYAMYAPGVEPNTLWNMMEHNRYLSSSSVIRHEDVTDAGELGVESRWSTALDTKLSFGVQSIQNLPVYADTGMQGIWLLAYGGRATAVTISAEAVAKLTPNDYFSTGILLRSVRDPFFGGRIPYSPDVEAGCRVSHNFGAAVVVNADVRFVGGQKADPAGKNTIPGYTVVNVGGDYMPLEHLKFSLNIDNLTDARYEQWLGYREFPLTARAAIQIKW